jgi:hypothetical protein
MINFNGRFLDPNKVVATVLCKPGMFDEWKMHALIHMDYGHELRVLCTEEEYEKFCNRLVIEQG